MANVDRPGGFRPIGHTSGSPVNGAVEACSVAVSYATALFVGQPVKSSGTADDLGRRGVELAAAGERMLGVITGIKIPAPEGAQEHPGYLPASTGGIVYVNTSSATEYEVQEDGNMGVVAVGSTVDHVDPGGSTVTGNSAAEIDSSTVGTGAGFKVERASQRVDNEPANVNAKWIVTINEHENDGDGVAV